MRAIAIILALLPLAAIAQDLTEAQRAEVADRIKPYGHVCLPGEACSGAAGDSAVAAVRSGEDVYNGACMACHTTGAAGAPMLGDAAAWAPRIAKGIEALYDSGVNGVAGSGMIAKGGCMNCSDEEIYAAVDYMVDSAQ